MAKKIVGKKKIIEKESNIAKLLRSITGIYIAVVLFILPFYAPHMYYSIGADKWNFWIWATTIYIGVIAAIGVIYGLYTITKNDTSSWDGSKTKARPSKNSKSKVDITKETNSDNKEVTEKTSFIERFKNSKAGKWLNKNCTTTDYFVVGYLFICLLASAFSPYKEQIWVGTEGWFMGLWSQLGFVLVYFIISRTYKYSNVMMRIAVACASLVFFYAILMRFGTDPIGFYDGLTDTDKFNYISTLGQTSWFSSFLVLLVPISIIAYHTAKTTRGRVCSAIAVMLGYMSMVTQNSDSAYLALVAYTIAYFAISLKKYDYMMRFLEVMILSFASFVIIGILQITHPETATQLDRLSMTISQGSATKAALVAFIVIYVVMLILGKKGREPKVEKLKVFGIIVPILAVVGVVAGIIYIVLNTNGNLSITSDNNYLLFNDGWGNHRGINWKAAINTFINENWWRKLVGTGPDTYGASIYELYSEEITNYFYELTGQEYVVYCAHNEWINELITGGILGLIAYLGLFIATIVRCMRNADKHPELYGIALAIIAYIAHNVFCYQQVICTSVIFVFVGMAEALLRNGHTEWDEWEEEETKKNHTFGDILKQFMSV